MNHRGTEITERMKKKKVSARRRLRSLLQLGCLCVFSLCSWCLRGSFSANRDPAAWGSDHVGKPVPEFDSGDECLFCHRMDVGPTWKDSRHNSTIREVDPE